MILAKLQFQVGEIIACEAVKKSKKLLCSQVKIGSQVKQIVSGIKAHYTPEEMVGKKVMVLVNLKPAKLAGVLSEGMLLCAEDAERQSGADDAGETDAGRSRDLLRQPAHAWNKSYAAKTAACGGAKHMVRWTMVLHRPERSVNCTVKRQRCLADGGSRI